MRSLEGQTVSMVDVLWQVRLAKLQAQSTHKGDSSDNQQYDISIAVDDQYDFRC